MSKPLRHLSKRRVNQYVQNEMREYEQLAKADTCDNSRMEEEPQGRYNESNMGCNYDEKNDAIEENYSEVLPEMKADSVESANLDAPIEEKVPGVSSPECYSPVDIFNLDDGHDTTSTTTLANDLQRWVKTENISMRSVNSLLHILKNHGHEELPSDYRSLVKTPKFATKAIEEINGGAYVHFGVEKSILRVLEKYCISSPQIIYVLMNTDGISFAESSRGQMWPILFALDIENQRTAPFIIGAHYGMQKPLDANVFIKKCALELKEIMQGGLNFKGTQCSVQFKVVICDSPARCFLTYTKGHSGYFSCSKCNQKGIFLNHVILPEVDSPWRTDESFRLKSHPEHHTGTSLLEQLNIGMVSQVALDYMHLVCLGVVKRLISSWLKGPNTCRMTTESKMLLEENMMKLKSCIPLEFSRTLRPLRDFPKYKATEFRLILLYIGPVVLKSTMKPDFYKHFLLLSVGIRILCEPNFCILMNDFANSLLVSFVKQYQNLYGLQGLSYNIHNLIHLANEVKNLGPLDSFSCFPFENYLKHLKYKIKTAPKPLHQLVNRLHEENSLPIQKRELKVYPIIHRSKTLKIKSIEFEGYSISPKVPNNCFLDTNNSVVLVNKIYDLNENVVLEGKQFLEKEPLFREPFNSTQLNIFVCNYSSGIDVSNIPMQNINKKNLKLPYDADSFVSIPLIHH